MNVNRKVFSALALGLAGVLGLSGNASACTFDKWGVGGGNPALPGTVVTGGADKLVAGSPKPESVTRYQNKCGALSKQLGNFVQDSNPGNEQTYHVVFYVYTGLSAGGATVFRALNGGGTAAIQVDYDSNNSKFVIKALGSTDVTGVQKNKWYMVRLDWAKNATMGIQVQGAGSSTKLSTNNLSVTTGATDTIETAQLGWINGGAGFVASGTGAPGIVTDAFNSQRQNQAPRLKRGDADNTNKCDSADITRMAQEIIGSLLNQPNFSPGQPDCDEDGQVNSNDITCIAGVIIGDLLSNNPKTICGD